MATSNINQVFSFGEKGEDQWYENSDGSRIKCNEKIIDHLWKQWIMNPTAKRADDKNYTIFKVTEPAMLLNGRVNNQGKLII